MIQILVDNVQIGQVLLINGGRYKVISTSRNSITCQNMNDNLDGLIILRGQYKTQNFVVIE